MLWFPLVYRIPFENSHCLLLVCNFEVHWEMMHVGRIGWGLEITGRGRGGLRKKSEVHLGEVPEGLLAAVLHVPTAPS